MKTFSAVYGQSLADVCMNTYGSMDYFYKLLQDNNIQDANQLPSTNQKFVYDDTLVVDSLISRQVLSTNTIFATASSGNMNTFYIIVGDPNYVSTPSGYVPPPVTQVNMYQKTSATDYTSASAGGESVITFPALAGKNITQIEKNIQPLKSSEWSWVSSTGVLTLNDPIYAGEVLFIIYNEMITV